MYDTICLSVCLFVCLFVCCFFFFGGGGGGGGWGCVGGGWLKRSVCSSCIIKICFEDTLFALMVAKKLFFTVWRFWIHFFWSCFFSLLWGIWSVSFLLSLSLLCLSICLFVRLSPSVSDLYLHRQNDCDCWVHVIFKDRTWIVAFQMPCWIGEPWFVLWRKCQCAQYKCQWKYIDVLNLLSFCNYFISFAASGPTTAPATASTGKASLNWYLLLVDDIWVYTRFLVSLIACSFVSF